MGLRRLYHCERSVSIALDSYTLNARLQPALLVALPGAVTVAAWPSGAGLHWNVLCVEVHVTVGSGKNHGKDYPRRLGRGPSTPLTVCSEVEEQ